MSLYVFLIVSHVIGTVFGVGGVTFAEIFYLRAIKDGKVDPKEGSALKIIYRLVRIGLFLTVFSGFGFLLYFRLTGNIEQLYDPKLWAKLTIIVIIMINAIMLSMRSIVLWLGSAISLTSWYMTMILGSWRSYPYGFMDTMVGYVITVIVVAIVLYFISEWYLNKK